MSGVQARETIENQVKRELFGPLKEQGPAGSPIDVSAGAIRFEKREDSWGQFHDSVTLEEILTQSDPLRRYGVGVLYNGASKRLQRARSDSYPETAAENEREDLSGVSGLSSSEEVLREGPIKLPSSIRQDVADSDDFDLTDANTFKPSAMAISFKCRISVSGSLRLEVRGAYYDKIEAHIPGVKKAREWWVRRPIKLIGTVSGTDLLTDSNRLKFVQLSSADSSTYRIVPVAQFYSRTVPGEPDPDLRLVTLAVVNQSPGTGPSSALFQVGFDAISADGLDIEPYPEGDKSDFGLEDQSIELLYRKKRTFAIGHGCAADWWAISEEAAAWVRAEPLPSYEVTSLTPNIYVKDADGKRSPVVVSMDELAKQTPAGRLQVETVLSLYASWIDNRRGEIPDIAEALQPAAVRHMDACESMLERMKLGWSLVGTDPIAKRAFQLANEAMLFQQLRSRLPLRKVERGRDKIIRPVGPHPAVSLQDGQGNWRPFQVAFILASLPELVDPEREDRALVDLIFFPTGGGKTEAYLGASAISLVARRLRNPDDAGTDTLMRYTLRLLTAQQFLRAASLVCVLEDLRSRSEEELGSSPFGIGVWLGGSSTPNTFKRAIELLAKLRRDHQTQNPFLLLRCPWCGTQMGTLRKGKSGQDVIGYNQVGKRVELACHDQQCRFGGRKHLPVHVIDEEIYDIRPSIIIGTVDKFAMLAWKPEARRIFGLGSDGEREVSPPSLIIQDELHLISGPLGSMVGLYEAVIDDLCTDHRPPVSVLPKIIASTATIRRYEEQIRGLFGRERVALFPPHGLEEGRSFFAEPASLDDGTAAPGRRYVGLFSASLGSMQTMQVRVASATLQGATNIPASDRDGYWTNLNFLNSLRELGNTVSLLESDVPDYLTGLRRRDGIDPRWPRQTMELTSRRRSDEIPKAIEQLQLSYGEDGCIDICLASNIIEVGIDIDRLGLMTIVGQPKTTSQYIQVSGRVGRRADVSPGLVLTIYGAAKPRDRSHYERFRTYHQSLYAQVEPTSVTPFATPVLRRALHAAAVAYIRQISPATEPHPFPEGLYTEAISLIRERAAIADPGEVESLDRMANARARQWSGWERTKWEANAIGGDPKQGLMRFAGTLPDAHSKATIWDVPTSMRNVDAECRLKITLAYNQADDAFEGN